MTAGTEPDAPLRVRLIVEPIGREPRDVVIEAAADAPVAEVVAALSRAVELDGSAPTAVCARTGRVLRGDETLSASGLVEGDRLVLARNGIPAEPRSREPESVLELAVVGGPCAGVRVPLDEGEAVAGRDASCDVVLDDPSVSARHVRIRAHGDVVGVADAGSRNGTAVEGVALRPGEERRLAPGEWVQAGRTVFALGPAAPPGPPPSPPSRATVAFNRPPRVTRPFEPRTIRVDAPPSDPVRPRVPIAASLVPFVLGVALWLVTHTVAMLVFTALTPMMALSSYVESRRNGTIGFRKNAREYRRRLVALKRELDAERAAEAGERRTAAPAAPELLRRAEQRLPALWERRPNDDDFLSLRVGTAEMRSQIGVELAHGGNEGLRQEAERLLGWYGLLPPVPVRLPLGELAVAGLSGDAERVDALARWLVVQAATLHSPGDLVVAAALSPQRLRTWSWLKWLPHARAEGDVLETQLGSGRLAAREVVESVARLLAERRELAASEPAGRRRRWRPTVLLLVDEAVAPERALLADLLSEAGELGVAVLWLGSERRELPGECRALVEVDGGTPKLSATDARTGETVADASAEGLSVELAERCALALAPLRDTGAAGAAGRIPDRLSLLELLRAEAPDAEWIAGRWHEPPAGLRAVVGAVADGELALDLQADGPHGLVAGTTGAGKSELLQTLIASLAATYPPARLSFLLVDYKGGAAFKECVQLPHTVGFVTDLDDHLAQRALVSLNAELRRREAVLRDADAKDLRELERRDPARAPASLLIVIDEFATLAKEVPDFVQGVVDVAQRGRSLGVHLLLATQRPGGVVSENIRANTNLRIALRVASPAESSDVVGVGDAGRIPRNRPGRAYARTGHSELEEFQTAYVGGRSVRIGPRGVVVRDFGFGAAPRPLADLVEEADETDLQLLVRLARAAAEELRVQRPPSPWLPALEPAIPLERLAVPTEGATDPQAVAALGLLDEPALQRQRVFALDLEHEGSLLVYGASGAGKTTLLRTLALSLASRSSPGDLHLYGLDFATRGLSVLDALPHTGSVIPGDDEERVARLFAMLRKTLERRKHAFERRGAFTVSEYRRAAPGDPMPRILVLLDSYAGFAATFERVNLGELLLVLPRLVADGRPLGLHFAITADRRGSVPNSLAGIVPAKVILRMADDDEYMALGLSPRAVRGAVLPPGRGFVRDGIELQCAIPGREPSGEGQARALVEAGADLRGRYGEGGVPRVLPLPAYIERSELPRAGGELAATIAVGDTELQPVAVDLGERHFLVTGPYRSGRSSALGALAAALRERTPRLELHLLAPRRSPLPDLDIWTTCARGLPGCDGAAVRLAEVAQSAEARVPIVVVVDDGEEIAETAAGRALETIVRRGRDTGVRVVAAAERQAAIRAFGGFLRELRKEEYGLLLDPDLDTDGDLLGVRLPRRTNPIFPPGRGYLVERGALELVQVAL